MSNEQVGMKTHEPLRRFGIWQEITHPAVSRCLAKSGWDFVVLDMQHGAMSFETACECVHALRAVGTEPWIRIAIDSASCVQRALDIGAAAVVVPMVNSADTARRMASAAKYPPLGERSLGGDCWLYQGNDYFERANRATRLLVQIEHVDAVDQVEAITSLPGVDGCFVGPTDLALSMGLTRQGFESDPRHRQMIQRTLDACNENGKLSCCNTYSLPDAEQKSQAGFQYITIQSEVQLLLDAGTSLLDNLRDQAARVHAARGPHFVRAVSGTIEP